MHCISIGLFSSGPGTTQSLPGGGALDLYDLFSPGPRATHNLPELQVIYCTGCAFDLYGFSGTKV